jgi:hypothetical protein
LNIQTWQTAEGAKVLFVEARELPMFDLQLTFAAGSSHDDGVPGLAMLTNAMLNEGVPGKDVSAIAAGFEDLGVNFGNGAFRDMAIASLRSLSAAEQREPALQLFNQVLGQPTFPEDSLARIKNQLLAGFEYQKQNPGKLASLALFDTARTLTRTPATALPSRFRPLAVSSCRRSMPRPTPPITRSSPWSATFPVARPKLWPAGCPPPYQKARRCRVSLSHKNPSLGGNISSFRRTRPT